MPVSSSHLTAFGDVSETHSVGQQPRDDLAIDRHRRLCRTGSVRQTTSVRLQARTRLLVDEFAVAMSVRLWHLHRRLPKKSGRSISDELIADLGAPPTLFTHPSPSASRGAVFALSAAGATPISSCNGGTIGGMGIIPNGEFADIFADDILKFHAFAERLLDELEG